MAYTICDQSGQPKPIRMLMTKGDEPKLGEAFTPYWWTCDPCNPSSRRYEIEYRAEQAKPTGFPWYQVVTSDDDEADIALKIDHYRKVIAAQRALEAARVEYERLNGGR